MSQKQESPMQLLLKWAEYRQEKSANSQKSAWNMIIAKIKEDGLIEQENEFFKKQYEKGFSERPY